MFRKHMVITVVWAAMAASCGSGAQGGNDQAASTPSFALTKIALAGVTDTNAEVIIGNVPDEDGIADTNWHATLAMDGTCLPAYLDEGSYSGEIQIEATDAEDLRRVWVVEILVEED